MKQLFWLLVILAILAIIHYKKRQQQPKYSDAELLDILARYQIMKENSNSLLEPFTTEMEPTTESEILIEVKKDFDGEAKIIFDELESSYIAFSKTMEDNREARAAVGHLIDIMENPSGDSNKDIHNVNLIADKIINSTADKEHVDKVILTRNNVTNNIIMDAHPEFS